MKRCVLTIVLAFTFATTASAVNIAEVPWDQAGIKDLKGSDKVVVLNLINATQPREWAAVSADNVGEFGWVQAGGSKYNLAVLLDFSGRGLFNELRIYSRSSPGNVDFQDLHGWRMNNLSNVARDLGGNGSDDFIIPTEIASPGSWVPTMATPTWPAVYRLENGKYAEASRDFPNFYDTQILPKLDSEIRKAPNREYVATLTLEKYKILRVLGRNPAAGLDEAFNWMKSDDPQLMQCAIATFADIGGYNKQVRALQQKLPAAITREMATRKGA